MSQVNQHLERLNGVAGFLVPAILELMNQSERKLGKKILVVTGWRSFADQALKFEQGRVFDRSENEWVVTDKAKVVTDAKPGSSAHEVVTKAESKPAAVAVDLIPLDSLGAPEWTIGASYWTELYRLAWNVGLDPLGDLQGAYLKGDLGHFQEPGYQWKLDALGLMLPTLQSVSRSA